MKTVTGKITSIKKLNVKSKRYDISVEDNHNFFANNVLVHNCQSNPDALTELLALDTEVVGTMKMDGTSISCYIKDGAFGVTSRNMELIETEDNAYWKIVRECDIEGKMRSFFSCNIFGGDYVIQGELCGPGIQGNKMGLDKLTLFWYNVYHVGMGDYMSHKILRDFTLSTGLNMVEVVFQGKLPQNTTINSLLEIADRLDYKNGLPAEGIVWRPVMEQRSETLGSRMSFKTISNRFLELYKE
jgi:RNA ligase (TIGR02306 family)